MVFVFMFVCLFVSMFECFALSTLSHSILLIYRSLDPSNSGHVRRTEFIEILSRLGWQQLLHIAPNSSLSSESLLLQVRALPVGAG